MIFYFCLKWVRTNMKSKTIESKNPSNFYPNSAYRSSIKKTKVTRKIPAGIVAKYIAAMNACETLGSEENFKYLEEVKKEYKDFLESNQ